MSSSPHSSQRETTHLLSQTPLTDTLTKKKHTDRCCDICQWLRQFLFAPPTVRLCEIPLTKTQRVRFEDVRRRASILYDPDQDEHIRALYSLGIAVFGESFAQSDIKSEKWKLIGFQGIDPATDFRSSGLFGLQNLSYFVHTQRPAFRRLCGFDTEKEDLNDSTSNGTPNGTSTPLSHITSNEHYLPCALAGINITFMLCNLLSIRRSLKEPLNQEAATCFQSFVRLLELETYTFEELYCECFLLLEELWHIHHARYMDFNNILARVRNTVAAALQRNPINMRDFHRILSQMGEGQLP